MENDNPRLAASTPMHGMSAAANLPPITFVHRDISTWLDVAADSGRNISDRELGPRLKLGREIWIVQTFQRLRARGFAVRLDGVTAENSINFLHADDLVEQSPPASHFVVCVRADRDPCFMANLEVVQNRGCIWKANDLYIPHWPQPAVLPRLSARRDSLRRIVYMGKDANLDSELRSDGFRSMIRELGMELVLRGERWWDYTDVDAVLAVRSGARLYLDAKPASKLVNAWYGECPAIVGRERGYREVRKGPLDFLECRDAADVLGALAHLRDRPDLYRAMVENGRTRRVEFSQEAVGDHWVDAIQVVVAPAFRKWRAGGGARSKAEIKLAKARQRVWGTRLVQEVQPLPRRALNWGRRAVTLPRSVLR
jgi:hypothetical protein